MDLIKTWEETENIRHYAMKANCLCKYAHFSFSGNYLPNLSKDYVWTDCLNSGEPFILINTVIYFNILEEKRTFSYKGKDWNPTGCHSIK